MRFRWRVSVVRLHQQQRHTLLLTTDSANARDAHRAALQILRSWPLGYRVVMVAPDGPEVWATTDSGVDTANDG